MRMVEMEKNFVTMIDNSDDDHDRQQRRRRQLVDQALLDAEGQDLSSSAILQLV
uniref:Uncharacterized protein n=1 Tax=Daucus carota subsp. sativus TaxID=79200 RepID=A0A164YZK1_DAUCS